MKNPVNIPAICPYGNGIDGIGSYVSSQPIIQLKELEVDRVRYDQWKASLVMRFVIRLGDGRYYATGRTVKSPSQARKFNRFAEASKFIHRFKIVGEIQRVM